jgi:hypothetical protein
MCRRDRNLEIPGLVLTHHPGMTVYPRNNDAEVSYPVSIGSDVSFAHSPIEPS